MSLELAWEAPCCVPSRPPFSITSKLHSEDQRAVDNWIDYGINWLTAPVDPLRATPLPNASGSAGCGGLRLG